MAEGTAPRAFDSSIGLPISTPSILSAMPERIVRTKIHDGARPRQSVGRLEIWRHRIYPKAEKQHTRQRKERIQDVSQGDDVRLFHRYRHTAAWLLLS